MSRFKVGDKVAYSANFLASLGHHDITHSMSKVRGVIIRLRMIGPIVLAEIRWDDEEIPTKVITNNLAKVGQNAEFARS